jgi:hypothetical protein
MQLRLEPADLSALAFDIDYTITLTAGFAGSAVTSTASTVSELLLSLQTESHCGSCFKVDSQWLRLR